MVCFQLLRFQRPSPQDHRQEQREEDKAKFDALSQEEQDALVDLTSSATMSLQDSHGDILSALRAAYDARKPIDVSADQIAGMGLGFVSNGRQGPGSDDQDVPVYSMNMVFAATLLDANDKMLDVYVDQVEVATPNYDGDGMPHFSGWPGRKPTTPTRTTTPLWTAPSPPPTSPS